MLAFCRYGGGWFVPCCASYQRGYDIIRPFKGLGMGITLVFHWSLTCCDIDTTKKKWVKPVKISMRREVIAFKYLGRLSRK